jgi:Ca2+-transporting ATPase
MDIQQLKHIVLERYSYQGLTATEVEERHKQHGFNIRQTTKHTTWLKRLLGIIGEPMMILLFITTVIYFIIGSTWEAFPLLFSLIPIIIMEFLQEQRTDQAIRVLDNMIVEYAEVYRDRELQKVEIKELVPGDLVYITAGDKVPADGYFLRSPGALVDESILTGESAPVAKLELPNNLQHSLEEYKLNQGTLVVQGEGYMLVVAIGADTAYGKLGSLLEGIKQVDTPLQRKIEHLVKLLAIVAVGIALMIGVILTFKYGFIKGLLGSLTIAIAIIPEEFPIVFSVFLIMGVWRMSKQKALVRHMAMIETLGSATVICSDKTGTLTQGSLTLEKIFYKGQVLELRHFSQRREEFKEVIESSLLALEQVAVDPIELEVQRFARQVGISVTQFFKERILVKDSSFDAQTKTVSHRWQDPQSRVITEYIAGAPEFIIEHCDFDESEKKQLEEQYRTLAHGGYRVIGIAKQTCDTKDCIGEKVQFVALLVMSDPPREEVKPAIQLCLKAGIRIIMITGDNQWTALHVAEHVGLPIKGRAVSGTELEHTTSKELAKLVKHSTIFYRVRPEQKYALVEALQAQGEVVAMTGDGVNDAPALKKANIGVAMGEKGTEVARAAAGIVLMDDNFVTIVTTVKEGRKIYDNLRQAFVFLFSFHLPIIGLSIIPLLLGQELFFLPIHIIFLELFCDPAAVIGFERDEAAKGVMSKPPRLVTEPLVNPQVWWQIILQALGIMGVSFAFYYYYAIVWGELALGRTAAFSALLLTQLWLILLTREWQQVKKNKFLLTIIGMSFVVLSAILFIAPVRELFHFVPLTPLLYGWLILLSGISMGIVSLLVRLIKKRST